MKKTDKELVEMIAKSLHNKGEHGKALDVVEIYNNTFKSATELYEYLDNHELLVNEFVETHGENGYDILTSCQTRSEVDFYIK